MIRPTATRFINTYNNGQPYVPARGRYAPRARLEDCLALVHPVVNLSLERPTPEAFLGRVIREMRLRYYQPKSIKSYRNALTGLLRWFGGPPHKITREHVRCYLELLVDSGASASWVSVNISAICTAFDKMCGRQVTRPM